MRAFLLSLESACNRHVVNNIYRPPPSTPLCTYHTTDTPAGTGPSVARSALRSALANTPSAGPEVDTRQKIFKEYAPRVFGFVRRELFGVSNAQYIASLEGNVLGEDPYAEQVRGFG